MRRDCAVCTSISSAISCTHAVRRYSWRARTAQSVADTQGKCVEHAPHPCVTALAAEPVAAWLELVPRLADSFRTPWLSGRLHSRRPS